MTPKSEHLVDLIFKKLKNYKAKEILLKKESLLFTLSILILSWHESYMRNAF